MFSNKSFIYNIRIGVDSQKITGKHTKQKYEALKE